MKIKERRKKQWELTRKRSPEDAFDSTISISSIDSFRAIDAFDLALDDWVTAFRAKYRRKTLAEIVWVAERARYAALTLTQQVETDPEKRGGIPVLRGTRFTVAQLLAELSENRTMSEIAEAYRLDSAQIQQVLESLAIVLDRPTSS